jgi:hypothetical protein
MNLKKELAGAEVIRELSSAVDDGARGHMSAW